MRPTKSDSTQKALDYVGDTEGEARCKMDQLFTKDSDCTEQFAIIYCGVLLAERI